MEQKNKSPLPLADEAAALILLQAEEASKELQKQADEADTELKKQISPFWGIGEGAKV